MMQLEVEVNTTLKPGVSDFPGVQHFYPMKFQVLGSEEKSIAAKAVFRGRVGVQRDKCTGLFCLIV